MDIKMINLGVYYEHLKQEIERLITEAEKAKDPYQKWNFLEQIRLVEKLLVDYETLIMNQ